MKYALLIYATEDADRDAPVPPGAIANWIDYTVAVKESGALLGAERLRPVETATSVRIAAGERLLTDGPYIETKEHLLGFCLIEVADLDAALDWAARMPVMSYGVVEVRPVTEGEPWQAISTTQRFGSVFGVAVVSAVFAAAGRLDPAAEVVAGFRPALAVAAGLSLLGALAGLAVGALPARASADQARSGVAMAAEPVPIGGRAGGGELD